MGMGEGGRRAEPGSSENVYSADASLQEFQMDWEDGRINKHDQYTGFHIAKDGISTI